ncbi:MAG: VOC family protein [Burkholderiales bacterium]|nr:VOC family protein [Burkholderiales bacterium]
MDTALALDHVGVCGGDLNSMVEAYERLGFTLSPQSQQSGRRRPDLPVETYGTANRCAMFHHGYLELLGIIDRTKYDHDLGKFLARYTGAHIIAFSMDDENANLDRLRASGVPCTGPAHLQRPTGTDGTLFRSVRLPYPDAPEGRLQLTRKLTPELLWQEPWMDHTNHVVALESVLVMSADIESSARRFSQLCGIPAKPDPDEGFILTLPGGCGAAGPKSQQMKTRVRIVTEATLSRIVPGFVAEASPCIAAAILRTDDGNAAFVSIAKNAGIAMHDGPEGPVVPANQAGGMALVLQNTAIDAV